MTETLPTWQERPRSAAAMFNPGLTAATVAATANQFEETSGMPLPWSLAFLSVPLVLHKPTRDALPRNSRTALAKWVEDQPVLTASFPARAKHLSPFVREGVRFGLQEDILELVGGDRLRAHLPRRKPEQFGDIAAIIRASGMVGRVFGKVGSTFTVYATLRVQP